LPLGFSSEKSELIIGDGFEYLKNNLNEEETIFFRYYFSLIMATSIAEILQFKINDFSKIIFVSF
jgi:hypothetical protein